VARSTEANLDLPWWRGVPSGPALPRDASGNADGGFGLAGDEAAIMASLSASETGRLLAALSDYQAQVNEILLGALAMVLAEWTGALGHTVALEGHGREALPGLPAVSEAIGWFTALFPLRLELPEHAPSPGAAVLAVKSALRETPRRGFGYGLLRYLGSAEAQAALRNQPWPELCFNYLGQLDGGQTSAAGFGVAGESRGSDHGPANSRRFLIEVSAALRGDTLETTWTYSRAHHDTATVERLVGRFLDQVRTISAAAGDAGAEARDTSDFSAAGLSQGDLAKILGRRK
jgi:non-ribosomal peptide synthase protein (TIGR01720 family)